MQAMLHRNGESELGLPPNAQLFHEYLRMAESLGDPEALFCLADMHLNGA
jgi:TPR repeat protein